MLANVCNIHLSIYIWNTKLGRFKTLQHFEFIPYVNMSSPPRSHPRLSRTHNVKNCVAHQQQKWDYLCDGCP